MATPDSTNTVKIYPYPLTNLQVTSTVLVTIQDMSTYYLATGPIGSTTISCDEYVDKTYDISAADTTVCVSNLYAWTSDYGTVYTASATPAVSDTVYNADGVKITSISNGSEGIDWSSTGGLTAVSSSEITITGDRM